MHRFLPNFQGIFTPSLGAQEDLELVRFWGVSGNDCCHGNTLKIFGSQSLWVFHSLKWWIDFHQIFRICLPQEDLELIGFCGVPSNNWCHGNNLNIFGF